MVKLLALSAVLTASGCGVDATRSMWSRRWTAPDDGSIAHGAKRVAEVAGKSVLTPGTVTVDFLTDENTWLVVLYVTFAVIDGVVRCACECH
jgi:hypothetical protein